MYIIALYQRYYTINYYNMPYYCSCKDKDGNTLTSTVLGQKKVGSNCLELQQVQFRIYEAAPRMNVLNWAQTFTITPDKPIILCQDGAENTVTVPWTGITETLMEVTTVKPYGDVATTIQKDGTVRFDRFDVSKRCGDDNNLCPLNFQTIVQPVTAIEPFKTTT